jgi:hypothetical protein
VRRRESRQSAHRWRWGFQPYAPAAAPSPPPPPPQEVSGTHSCSGLSQPQGLVRTEGLGEFKKFSDPIGRSYPYVDDIKMV